MRLLKSLENLKKHVIDHNIVPIDHNIIPWVQNCSLTRSGSIVIVQYINSIINKTKSLLDPEDLLYFVFEYQFQPIQYVKFEQFSKKSLILFAIAMHDAITDFILLHPLSCMMQYFWQYLLKVVHHILKIVSSSLIVLHDFYSKNLCE